MADWVDWEKMYGREEKEETKEMPKNKNGIFPNKAPVFERLLEHFLTKKGMLPSVPLNIIELQLRMQENKLKPSKEELST